MDAAERRLTHYSRQPFVLSRSRTYSQEEFGNGKPRGLWLSDDSSFGWAEWCRGEEWNTASLAHAADYTLAPGANVLVLSGLDDILAFTAEYQGHPSFTGRAEALASHWIDWERVASVHDGILITPYSWNARSHLDTMWYYGWDCASACVWNLEVLVDA